MPPKSPKNIQPSKAGDIRSFFSSKPASTSAKSSKDADTIGKPKGKRVMLISDSDDSDSGPFESSKASSKKAKVEEKVVPKVEAKAKIPPKVLKPVEDLKSVFGSQPIKKSNEPVKRKLQEAEDVHSDDDFQAALAQAEKLPVHKKSKVKEERHKSPTKSPEKNGNTSAKPLTTVDLTENSPKKKSADKTSPMKKEKESVVKLEKQSQSKVSEDSKSTAGKNIKEASAGTSKKTKKVLSTMTIDSPDKSKSIKTEEAESPSFDPLEKRKQRAENYRKFLAGGHKEGAKNPGSKVVPKGAPNCLSGLTIIVTGVLDSLYREEAEQLVEKYGGKATKSISKKTSYVLAGEDAGPAKLTKAKELNVPLISEDDFLNMIATRAAGEAVSSPAPRTPKSSQKTTVKMVTDESSPYSVQPQKKSPEAVKAKSIIQPPKSVAAVVPASTSNGADSKEAATDASLPWVDKYKPTAMKHIIGMQTDKSVAKKLLYWLQNWYKNHSGNKKPTRPAPWAKDDDGAYFKAALLSGSPGIGKTTTAHLVAKELGYDLVEMNASDTRSKRLLHEHVMELLSSQSLNSYAHGSAHIEGGRKRVLVMDEVDGMAGNEDRGGIQELIALIKTSKIPVICICNDRNHQKIRSLSNYCYDLRFKPPTPLALRGAMMGVCFKENLKLKPDALDEIIAGCNCDVRQVLHHLSMLAAGNKSLTAAQAKVEASKSRKDLKLGPWDVVKKVFSAEEHRGMSIHDKTGLFFHDYSFGPLFNQELYPMVTPDAAGGSKIKTLDLIGRTAECFSQTDLIEKQIRSQNAWSLLPVEAIFASVVPGQLMEGRINGQIGFPSWLGKNSRQNKVDRLLAELQMHMRLRISASKRALNLDYLPHIVGAIVKPLRRNGASGIEAAVRAMESYDLTREDLDSLLELSQWPFSSSTTAADLMPGVDTKVKTAFTRAFNKDGHMTPYASSTIKKGRSLASSKADEEGFGDEDGDEGGEGEDVVDVDDLTKDAMIKVKVKSKAASKGSKAAAAAASTDKPKKERAPAGSGGAGGGRGRKKAD